MISRRFLALLAVLTLALVTSCGGGGIGGTGKQVTNDRLIVGVVDGFGSIIINQKRYDTDTALVYADGNEATLADLKVGMKVSARVSADASNATEIHYQPNVSGPIQSVDLESGYFEIYGQRVRLTDQTVFDEMTREQLLEGATVEVSGDRDADNQVVARYIRMASNVDSTYTTGIVEYLENGMVLVAGSAIDLTAAAQNTGLTEEEYAEIYLAPGIVVRISPTDNQDGTTVTCNLYDSNTLQGLDESLIVEVCSVTLNGTLIVDGEDGTVIDGIDGLDGLEGLDGLAINNGVLVNGNDTGDAIVVDGGDEGNGLEWIIANLVQNGELPVESSALPVLSAIDRSGPEIKTNDSIELLGTITDIVEDQLHIGEFRLNTGSSTEIYSEFGTPITLDEITENATVLIEGHIIDDKGNVATKTIRVVTPLIEGNAE